MGTSRRYAASVDRDMDKRILGRIAHSGPLQTLTAEELQLDRTPVTIDPQPSRVRAWVRFGPASAEVDAEACRWTDRAVAIRFLVEDQEQRCWVWRGAVRDAPTG
ncbi:hypothetical protein [Microbacterium sp.]|uniref:hypothetical protein n=1 Tax=Microbacterium sp. TaxID=51671 RepID=UPI003C7212BF